MSDLIRGGQVTFHKFRMLMQVSKVLARVGLVLLVISIFYSFYANIKTKDWEIAIKVVKQELLASLDHEELAVHARTKLYVCDKFLEALDKGMILAAIMEATIIGGTIVFFWVRGRGIKQTKNIRGVFAITDKELKQQIYQHNKVFKVYHPFKIADFSYPITGRSGSWSSGEQSHTLVIGSTGSGKTTIIKNLIAQLERRKQKAIIVDIKGDLIESFYSKQRGDTILNPLDARGANWSIFKETNPLKGFATIARSLLPKGSKSDPIWIDAARGVVAELASLYMSENLSMNEFADKILKSELSFLSKLLHKTSASKIINEDIEKAALSVLMVLSTYLRPFKLYRSAEDCFSITDWVNDNSQQNFLFISSRADVKEDLNPIITTQVDIAINALRSLTISSNIPRIWFILDEIAYFDQSIPSLKDGLATARSFGGCFVLGAQDMSSLTRIYSAEIAQSIANNCRTKLFMNVAGKETAIWCSDSLGEGEMEEWHEGLSYGAHEMRDGIQVNQQRVMRKNVLASELMMLKSGEGYVSLSGFAPARFKFPNCYFKKTSLGFEENTQLYQLFKEECEEAEQRRREIERKLTVSQPKVPELECEQLTPVKHSPLYKTKNQDFDILLEE